MFDVGGLEIDNHRTSLPVKKGLSSSAAVCVLVARSFSRAYGLGLSIRGEMELAFQARAAGGDRIGSWSISDIRVAPWAAAGRPRAKRCATLFPHPVSPPPFSPPQGEILTPSHCGRMDQACAYGSQPVVLRFDGEAVEVEELKARPRTAQSPETRAQSTEHALCSHAAAAPPGRAARPRFASQVGAPLHLVVADLAAAKDTVVILEKLQAQLPPPPGGTAPQPGRRSGAAHATRLRETRLGAGWVSAPARRGGGGSPQAAGADQRGSGAAGLSAWPCQLLPPPCRAQSAARGAG